MKNSSALLYKTSFHLLIILLLGLVTYSNTFNVPFHFDDATNISGNSSIRDFDAFEDALKKGGDLFWGRDVGYFSFALNYRLHGLEPFGYHALNISIHLINALLVYWLVCLTFRTPVMEGQNNRASEGKSGPTAALLSALVFVAHPVQTQAVTYIVQRFASLATLFYLLALVLYIRSRLSSTTAARYGLYAASFLCSIIAMRTKEIAFTLPVVILLYEFMFFEGDKRKRYIALVPLFLTMLSIPLSHLQSGAGNMDLLARLSDKSAETVTISRHDYLVTQFRVIVTYLRLLFFPLDQNLDYDYPVYTSFFAQPVLFSMALLLALFALGVYAFQLSRPGGREDRRILRLAAFGIFYFFITLSVESSILPIRDVIFEHRLYLPSAGLIIGTVVCMMIITDRCSRFLPYAGKIAGAMALLVILLFAAGAYARNIVWQNETTLWEDVARKSPMKYRGHINLGDQYRKQGRFDDALREFRTALSIKPDLGEVHNNLGVIYLHKALFDNAVKEFRTALLIRPDDENAHNNLGLAYFNKGDLVPAEKEYKAALGLKPDFAKAFYNLGLLREQQKRLEEAKKEYLTAFKFNPLLLDTYMKSGVELYRQGDLDGAMLKYRIIAEIKPDYVQAPYNMGLALMGKGRPDEAADAFRSAIRLKPDLGKAYYNLGLVLQGQGRYAEAAGELETAVKMSPGDAVIRDKYEAVRAAMKGDNQAGKE
jgi:tetratricopeptide (TPR) repeat protein